ncbi:MAG: head GIN domain-containing protein [Pseudonocardia sp.]
MGSGPQKTETRAVSGVSALQLNTSGDVQVSAGPTTSLTIEAPADVLPLLTSDVVGGTLELSIKDGTSVRTRNPIVYRLTVPKLDQIEVNGSGDVTFPDLATGTVRVAIDGSGTVTLGGTADRQEVEVSGSGNYIGDRLATKTAQTTISGSGDVTLQVSDRLEATVSGSGTVHYRGNPSVTKNISGSGEVTPG